MNKPLVGNAADEGQIKEAGNKVKFNRETELRDLQFVLQTRQGRNFLWRLMSHCRPECSAYDPHNGKQSYNIGKIDVGTFIKAEIIQADEESFFKMMREAKENSK